MTPPLTWTDDLILDHSLSACGDDIGVDSEVAKAIRDTTVRDCCKAQCEWCRQDNQPVKETNGEWWHKVDKREYACKAAAIREMMA